MRAYDSPRRASLLYREVAVSWEQRLGAVRRQQAAKAETRQDVAGLHAWAKNLLRAGAQQTALLDPFKILDIQEASSIPCPRLVKLKWGELTRQCHADKRGQASAADADMIRLATQARPHPRGCFLRTLRVDGSRKK